MKIKCVGVLEHRNDKRLWLYAMTEEFLTGANHVIEAVHRTLEARKKETGRLPQILYVQVDNCTRENKNRYFLSYFELLIALGAFLEVEVSFLPVGHTRTDIDQAFSAVSAILKRSDAPTMEDLLSVLGRCYNGKATADALTRVMNYSVLCEQQKCLVSTRNFSSFTEYRYFRFSRAAGRHSVSCPGIEKDIFATECHVKIQSTEEWSPISQEARKSLFKLIPDLRSTPQTETFPPDNVTEVNQCLASIHNRNRKVAAQCIPQLQNMRDEVYTKRFDNFWELKEFFEMNGDYLTQEAEDVASLDEEDGDDQSTDDIGEYETETFIAVKPCNPAKSLFWIAMVLQVEDRNSRNRPRWLRVLWYSQKTGSENDFDARYVQSQVYSPEQKRHIPYEDQVAVDSILLQFHSLNSQGYLRANTRSALRQTLGLN